LHNLSRVFVAGVGQVWNSLVAHTVCKNTISFELEFGADVQKVDAVPTVDGSLGEVGVDQHVHHFLLRCQLHFALQECAQVLVSVAQL